MTFPQLPLANPWVHGEQVDEIKLNQRTTTPLNTLAATTPLGYLASSNSASATQNLTALGTTYQTPAAATFTIYSQRRIKVTIRIRISSVGGNYLSTYQLCAGYNAGATVNNPTNIGWFMNFTYANPTPAGQGFMIIVHDLTLAAGTYTMCGNVIRNTGGNAGDQITGSYVLVEDMGGG